VWLERKSINEILRFGLVGVVATLIHYVIYWLLRQYVNYNIAYITGYVISFVCNFFLTSYFTFRAKVNVKRGVGFFCVHMFNMLFQIILLNIFVWIGIRQNVAPLFVFAIAIPIQFVLVRIVFKKD
jgi:putative flippase GtrA